MNNKEKLTKYIERINQGEDLDLLRKEFKDDFQEVNARDIVEAESEILKDIKDPKEIAKLCDLHASLFSEDVTRLEMEASESVKMKSAEQASEVGHPLNILSLENDKIEEKLKSLGNLIKNDMDFEVVSEKLGNSLDEIKKHYEKKAALIYPFLVKYGTSGPSNIMWTNDDQIRERLNELIKTTNKENYQEKKEDLLDIITKAREMVFKEKKILFPSAEITLSQGDWYEIYLDMKDFGYSFLKEEEIKPWPRADLVKEALNLGENEKIIDESSAKVEVSKDQVINFPLGSLTIDQVKGVFNNFPFELTYIDENSKNKYFPKESPLFARPKSALNREVFECHPPKVVAMAKEMIENLKNKKIRSFTKWSDKEDKKILVRYVGVYDENDEFIGVMELVEDMGEALELMERDLQL